MPKWCAVCVQAVLEQGVLDALSVEHAADAINAEAPERTFAVAEHQAVQPLELLPSGWVEVQVTAFPACPGVRRDLQQLRGVGLGQGPERTPQLD